MNYLCLKADFRGKHKLLRKEVWRDPKPLLYRNKPRPARLPSTQLKSKWQMAAHRRESYWLTLLSCCSSLQIIYLLLLCLLITQQGHMHLSQLYRALKLLISSSREFKSPNPSSPVHYSEYWANMVLLNPRWMIKVLWCL